MTKENIKNPSGRVLRGTVVSTKMTDTITVAVDRYVMHPKYKKFQKRSKKFLVHDAGNTAKEGMLVDIKETRPLSKRKHFELVTINK
ncbi:30S ribosomal protein S17 [Candidatus Kaiserbacteria bacterium CG_4_8_14_3_um_filter_38_9]|uniref:Small ribosomal subunit protein uS17 n=1 Tax=Candidatus Kaiserbacteria bacterium CG_4_8_14_3_um_filter_38_9 TaxID=1974599 RepID=A0A2M7ING6_9BACT|nr:30S ribosomal protein S17 [Candidatus Kaiserbacteria bacterium]PIW96883.1 MAG: 30S ribosomal protein S17 [Candidatus Kaiserbacteria bacterium CG_4_8_14_3_um_filter_38_9]